MYQSISCSVIEISRHAIFQSLKKKFHQLLKSALKSLKNIISCLNVKNYDQVLLDVGIPFIGLSNCVGIHAGFGMELV